MDLNHAEIIDISQPITPNSAVFPGDVPFSAQLTASHSDSGVINLTAFTMSPHVGTHADAPSHITGSIEDTPQSAGHLPLAPYLGDALVIDLAPHTGLIDWSDIAALIASRESLPPRLLFKTRLQTRYDVFEDDYAAFAPTLIDALAERGVKLLGIDTPSVDPVDSKTLETHHRLNHHRMVWLENLDLTHAPAGHYTLIALPLKLTTLEASPVRAILLK